jgi:hypothetical protein
MKKGLFILTSGIALAIAAYACIYFVCTSSARDMEHSSRPELAWLKEEFHLSDAEFDRVSKLHAAYLPQCAEICRQIDAQNQKLKALMAATNQVTPEIAAVIAESTRLRGVCQSNMLRHFYEVSRTMPPEEGKRYLEWIEQKTFLSDSMMPSSGQGAASAKQYTCVMHPEIVVDNPGKCPKCGMELVEKH